MFSSYKINGFQNRYCSVDRLPNRSDERNRYEWRRESGPRLLVNGCATGFMSEGGWMEPRDLPSCGVEEGGATCKRDSNAQVRIRIDNSKSEGVVTYLGEG
ncbi:uncharacterized protein DS421_5g137890 [Arachis hypogaea]|nr:uncharacterized protein DS421_5g137890 [Arachis hypogaea]